MGYVLLSAVNCALDVNANGMRVPRVCIIAVHVPICTWRAALRLMPTDTFRLWSSYGPLFKSNSPEARLWNCKAMCARREAPLR